MDKTEYAIEWIFRHFNSKGYSVSESDKEALSEFLYATYGQNSNPALDAEVKNLVDYINGD